MSQAETLALHPLFVLAQCMGIALLFTAEVTAARMVWSLLSWMVGLEDLRGLFHPKCFFDSVNKPTPK